ncbi:hypothetical protein KFE25_008399 [Diacronema lutheri]|uniref:EGF-like domain-containing protein n=1 Tax=Diacronema lutheri TaxID=2081491 RepID=A0A8J6C191_DIALT|nr:hypothetical protein KFE25_008399 [Diacronema lutheri]
MFAVGAAGLLIFLNYQYVLVKPNVVQRTEALAPLGAPLGAQLAQPAEAGVSAPAPRGAHPSVGEHTNRISQLEAEVVALREQLAQAHSSRVVPPAVPAARAAVAARHAERPCPYSCGPEGTCNRAIGECSCPPHRTGRNCSEPMFPACASMWGFALPSAPCGLPEATFPITCECAQECDDANLLMRRMCFEHRPPTDEGRQRARRWQTGTSDERWTMTAVDNAQLLELINERAAESRREARCSGHGIWMAQLPRWVDPPGPITAIPAAKFDPAGAPVCICMPTRWGDRCEHTLRSATTCLNRCNGRGRCVDSVCACDDGFWGADCTLRINPAGGYSLLDPPRPDHGVTARVYVYELPGRFTTWLAAQSNAHEWTHSWWFYDNDISLHQRFLASPYRTANPEEADFFFVPLYRSLGAYTAGWGPGVITPKGWRAFSAAVDFVRKSAPFFAQPGGARKHMMVITCDVGFGVLGEWQGKRFVHRSVLPAALSPLKFIVQWGGEPTRPGHDLVIPPRTPPQEVISAAGGDHPYACAYAGRKQGTPRAPTERGGAFFFFRGKIILGNPVYSQGVRQKVYRLHHQRDNWVISDQSSRNFYHEMATAQFCFAPTGWGWGQRVFEAILSGCIPVVMQSDNAQPFEHILPWDRFAVMLNESHIPRLHEILAAIPMARVESLQRTLSCVWPRLAFFSSPAQKEAFGSLASIDAFEMMMLELSAHQARARGDATAGHAWENATRILRTGVCSCAMTAYDSSPAATAQPLY